MLIVNHMLIVNISSLKVAAPKDKDKKADNRTPHTHKHTHAAKKLNKEVQETLESHDDASSSSTDARACHNRALKEPY